MNYTVKSLNIEEIIYESNDPEVLVKGKMFDGVLSYFSQITISFTQLNALLGKLCAINDSIDLNNLFEEEPLFDGTNMFIANLSKFGNVIVDVDDFDFNAAAKKIRA